MTKKDYENAARIVQELTTAVNREAATWAFVRLFEDDSPRFDEARFRRACEPGANVRARRAS